MNQNKKISIVVPVYNVENYLKKCVKSIIKQTYKNLEIILVDDGSTDNSGKICDELKKEDNRIKVIHKKNGGLSDARNAGIEIATGEFIGFIDSDDYIKEDMYEYLYDLIIKNDANISICGYTICYKDLTQKDNKIRKNKVFSKEKAIKELLKEKNIRDFAWNKLYRIDLFEDIRYPKGKKMEDVGTTYKLFYKSNTVVVGNKSKYFYVQREGSILNQKSLDLYIDYFEICKERYYFLKEKFPNMMENDVVMIEKIFRMYGKNQKEIKEYIVKNNIKNFYKEIVKMNNIKTFAKANIKIKIKMLLFSIDERLLSII